MNPDIYYEANNTAYIKAECLLKGKHESSNVYTWL